MSWDLEDIQECAECGALFVDYPQHMEWHRLQNERLAWVAQRVQRAAAFTTRYA